MTIELNLDLCLVDDLLEICDWTPAERERLRKLANGLLCKIGESPNPPRNTDMFEYVVNKYEGVL